jgi:hypothetical protein
MAYICHAILGIPKFLDNLDGRTVISFLVIVAMRIIEY